jgi:hypothetical protein
MKKDINLLPLAKREMEEENCSDLVFEYIYDETHNQKTDITNGDIIKSNITFEPMNPKTSIKVLIRPGTSVGRVILGLNKVIFAVSEHYESDWTNLLNDVAERVAAEEMLFAYISETGTPQNETGTNS